MSGYEPKHEAKCPYCGQMAPYEIVDIGVGEQQCAPAVCQCGARQMMPDDAMRPPATATPEERRTCWWRP